MTESVEARPGKWQKQAEMEGSKNSQKYIHSAPIFIKIEIPVVLIPR